MRRYELIVFLWVGFFVWRDEFCFADEGNAYDRFESSRKTFKNNGEESRPSQGWPWEDSLKKLGIHESVEAVQSSVYKTWQESLRYDNLQRDWINLKSEPLNPFILVSFIRNATLPAVCKVIIHAENGWKIIYREVMAFTRRKCDKLLGSEAPLHPWNIIKQDKETVSFVVFIYAAALSVILIRLCSLWNFICLLAVGYTTYVLRGPYFFFRWLVFMTGGFWILFEMIVTYPLQSALLFIAWYFSSYIISLLQGVTGSNTQRYASNVTHLRVKIDSLEQRVMELEGVMRRLEAEHIS